ncbi:L-lactate MFS transporter [Desulfofundulus thermocisternus]|uniref:L-lactate MFS transporter n=1 Tax=Desulfofundulus thermocisternus TaxID=42471 RepID=UPI0019DFCE32|nr:OFA family MFS transporter [Desulfofundulus thermocisternus]MBE3585722.1 OFA family MFS transporter [Thermoanaerobacter sp.]MCS5696290.1 OFA family MFS transporter [Desulfofundulus thermocisternus]
MNQPNQPSLARAWSVPLAGMGINLALGVLYTWSVFAAALIDQLHWTKTQSQFPYTLACVMFALFMVPAGRMVDKFGPRLVATIGGILAGAGMIISGVTQSLAGITIGFGLIVGAALGFGYGAPTPAAVKWFQPHKKGLIAGLVVAGFGLASVYTAPMTKYFLANYGISRTFIYEGIIFLAVIVILAQVLAFPPPGYVPYGGPPPATRAATAASSKQDFSPREMLITPQFYLLWLMFCFAASAGLLVIGHLAKIAQIQGGINWGFVFVAVLAIANAGGRVLAGWLSDRLGRTNTMLLVFAIQAANMLLFASYKSAATLFIGSVLTGIAYGANLSLFPSATYDYFGLKNAGINYGLVFTAWGAGALIGPIIAGRAADLTGGYNASYLISAALLVVAAILSFVTKPPVKPVSDGQAVKV